MIRRFALACVVAFISSCSGSDRPPGEIEGAALPREHVEARELRQLAAARALEASSTVSRDLPAKQILFGDLHVHTTYSIDAFTLALPIMSGQGAHTVADTCDFARYCADLDFYSLNDHAEGLTPAHWSEVKRGARECSASAGNPNDPDLVAFAGWEWTQVGLTPDAHWGHRNVIFPGTADAELPVRAISSRPDDGDIGLFKSTRAASMARYVDPFDWKQYKDLEWLLDAAEAVPMCPKGVPTRELPPDCHENAPSPADLYAKLDEWGFDALVIPHGTSWGSYTPPLASADKSLSRAHYDADRQRLVEVMSGHGNSEEYRDFTPFEDRGDELVCPEPTGNFLPCCWQAGEIMKKRCGDMPAAECASRVEQAKQLAMQANVFPANVFPDAGPVEWLDCDQCRDCFKPSFNYRPKNSVQYQMALSNLDERDESGRPLRFRYGFIASTDDHTSRPGTGYKQYARKKMTFSPGSRSEFLMPPSEMEDPTRPVPVDVPARMMDSERVTSFTFPGGIVAVHAEGRSREEIWDALERKETYGTSGPRMLLWFDLLNGPGGRQPMGSEAALSTRPRFEVRAAGAFVQKPGCPDTSLNGLSPDRLDALCAGECYHPGDERHAIDRIEIVRIRPRVYATQEIAELIDDPWKVHQCSGDSDGCVFQFEDEDFVAVARDTLYYARAVQVPTPAINGNLIRTEFDAAGNAIATRPCFGDFRTDYDDDCLAPAQERAWSSPIFVDWPRPAS